MLALCGAAVAGVCFHLESRQNHCDSTALAHGFMCQNEDGAELCAPYGVSAYYASPFRPSDQRVFASTAH